MKPYQFWMKTAPNGNFIIPNVIAGNNYTLYAFGPGAAGTFMSQNSKRRQSAIALQSAVAAIQRRRDRRRDE